jgi:hypothetical protein
MFLSKDCNQERKTLTKQIVLKKKNTVINCLFQTLFKFCINLSRNDLEDFLLEVLVLEDVGEAGILADRLAKLRNNLLPVTNMAIFVRNCK